MNFIINRKVLVSMLFLGLSLLGILSYNQLPLEMMPEMEEPYLIISINSSVEMNPDYFEKQAVIPLEGIASTLEGISDIESTIRRNRGTIYAYFNHDINIDYVYLKLQERINEIAGSIPEEFNVNLTKVDADRLSNVFMRLQVRGGGGLERVRSVIENDLIDVFESIDGISNVEVTGGEIKAMEIILNPDIAEAHNITPSRVRNLIRNSNRQKTFLGHAYDEDKHYFVNLISEFDDIRELENIIVDTRGPIYLKDIATINFGTKEQTTISRVNGKDAVIVQLTRDANTNLIDLSHTTLDLIERLNSELKSQDIEIVVQTNTAEEMETNINLIMKLALFGGMLAVIMLWFFIKNVRLVLTILLSIPVSILVAFNFFYYFGITLNSLTLVGIVLAIGMLLDNSVVVLENIYGKLSLNREPSDAVINGTKEVWRSITAATLTTIMVFLPFIFSTNAFIRLLGHHIGVSIIATLLVSLIVALVLIPMIVFNLLKIPGKRKEVSFNTVSYNNRLMQIYRLFLKFALRYPAATIISILVIFILSISICLSLSSDVPTEIESNQFDLFVTMSKGSTLENTIDVVTQIEEKYTDIEEIQDIISSIYEEEATITLILKEDFEKINNKTISMIKNTVEERIEDFRLADVSMTEAGAGSRFSGGMRTSPTALFQRMFGIGTQQEKVVIRGNDFEILRRVADNVEYYLNELETISNVRVRISGDQPEIHMLLDPQIMTMNNITVSLVSQELASFQNEVSSGLSFKQGTEEYDIIIRNENVEEEKSFDDLKDLQVMNEDDNPVILDEFSRLIFTYGASNISRLNQRKQIEVTYSFADEIIDSKSLLQTSRDEVQALIASINIPASVAIEIVHDESELSDFYFLIGASFLLIYMILASVFESLTTPIVMMFTIPLATIGSFWALILTGNSLFNANSLTGFLILLGVVVNNGIILIDYTNILRKKGWRRSRALMTAGQARVRPILITAITTIVALFPLAMGKTEYVSQIGASFAITVIGGLSLSTLFTLVFIPTVYSALENSLAWIRQLPLKLKAIQVVLIAALGLIIYTGVESILWQFGYFIVCLIAVPGLTWFVTTSLKSAQADIIPSTEKIKINIKRLVKIYDDHSQFVREWKKGERINRRNGRAKTAFASKDLEPFTWQIPLFGFLIYFVYFYMESQLWMFLLSFAVFFYITFLWNSAFEIFGNHSKIGQSRIFKLAGIVIPKLLFWGFPAFSIWVFKQNAFRNEVLVFIGLCWYLSLIVFRTSNKLHREKINIMRLQGRFAGIRKNFYRFVQFIPVIGKKKNPFRALDDVSLDIESGMFGLLGPNGAGKTTIMRIICGILEQRRGTIRINDIKFREKREELLGLIGYLPQEFGFYENMTAFEFLDYIAILKNNYDKEKREELVNYTLKSVHLDENMHRKIGTFSGGMKQRVGIAMILLNLPKILVVDEPTAGLDPRERIRFRNLMVELSKERIVIFSTHIIEDISSSCDRVAVLDKGELYYLGDPRKMADEAQGKVWHILLDEEEFCEFRNRCKITHHMQVEDKVRVRCLSETKPHANAESVTPSLEDAYLWLLGRKKRPKTVIEEEN